MLQLTSKIGEDTANHCGMMKKGPAADSTEDSAAGPNAINQQ
jgi:hypothetical protein